MYAIAWLAKEISYRVIACLLVLGAFPTAYAVETGDAPETHRDPGAWFSRRLA